MTIVSLFRQTVALFAAIMAIASGLGTAAAFFRGEWRSAALGGVVTAVWWLIAHAAERSSRAHRQRAAAMGDHSMDAQSGTTSRRTIW